MFSDAFKNTLVAAFLGCVDSDEIRIEDEICNIYGKSIGQFVVEVHSTVSGGREIRIAQVPSGFERVSADFWKSELENVLSSVRKKQS